MKLISVALIACIASGQVHRARYVPSSDEIRSLLKERIDRDRQAVGIVVGVIDSGGSRVISYGRLDDSRAVNGETIFEIGSLTKVFTALLLAEKARRGEVALTDPLSKHLPVSSSITLLELATNTSGLPRSPANLAPHDRNNPFAGYTTQMLYASLPDRVTPHWEYSNLGYGLLGNALAPDYNQAIRSRIAEPLALNATSIGVATNDQSRLARGYTAQLAPAPHSDFGALAPAAGLRSTANDLLNLLGAILGYTKSSLAPAMASMLDIREQTTQPGLVNALGWQVSMPDGFEIVWKDGTTTGFSSFLGYNPSARIGVVVLSNTASTRGVNDIGMHVLDGASPLFQAHRVR